MFNLFFHWKAHPWFKGIEWERLYESNAPYIPKVKHELDTQNFEKFDEVCSFFISSSIFILLSCLSG